MKKKLFCLFLVFALVIPGLPISAAEDCQHVWDSWYTVKKPTIHKTGLKQHECLECYKIQSKKTAKLKLYIWF